jgi:DNA modification methylase
VLKPGGSLFVNLGDKYSQRVATRMSSHQDGLFPDRPELVKDWKRDKAAGLTRMPHQNVPGPGLRHIPEKSRMGLPWRYAIRCIDELGLILRADIIWSKPNGLPESVTDRVRMSHEYVFHFTKQGRYFAAIDEVREEHAAKTLSHRGGGQSWGNEDNPDNCWADPKVREIDARGKVPGSVWTIPSEPLQVPAELGVDHFAAFPSELARRCILGWTPSGWCVECGEARRAVVDKRYETIGNGRGKERYDRVDQGHGDIDRGAFKPQEMTWGRAEMQSTIIGYACACPTTDALTTPAVVADFFCGTGTAPAVAHHLGRHGIGVDLSRDYLRLAEWRCSSDTRLKDKVRDRSGIPNPEPPAVDGQMNLFGEGAA